MSANDKQVGGSHYHLVIQPWDYIHKNGIGFLAGNVIRYVTRYKEKNGKEDLLKAIHFLEKLIEEEYPNKTSMSFDDKELPTNIFDENPEYADSFNKGIDQFNAETFDPSKYSVIYHSTTTLTENEQIRELSKDIQCKK
jgi:hypothetical protein